MELLFEFTDWWGEGEKATTDEAGRINSSNSREDAFGGEVGEVGEGA